jgi:hypothetical protein
VHDLSQLINLTDILTAFSDYLKVFLNVNEATAGWITAILQPIFGGFLTLGQWIINLFDYIQLAK